MTEMQGFVHNKLWVWSEAEIGTEGYRIILAPLPAKIPI